jgi:pimeloyl-ACP methyl ester carboxylesterase
MRAGFRYLGPVLPGLAGRLAYRLWFRTRRRPLSAAEGRWLEGAEPGRVRVDGVEVATYRWGKGPTVLLVHGWNGRGPQMGGLARALVEAGYQAVAFDAPAHGQTPGKATHIYEFTEAIEAVAGRFGPLHGIVAHSFGGMATGFALVRRLPVKRAVMIAPPSDVRAMVDGFAELLALPEAAREVMCTLFERDFGADLWWRFATTRTVGELAVPGLVVHDQDDEAVPASQGMAVARAWPGATFHRTTGLGHHRVLRHPAVLGLVRTFLDGDRPG